MDQPLNYSEAEFNRLPISQIDALARETKKAHGMYQRYSAAMDKINLHLRVDIRTTGVKLPNCFEYDHGFVL
jgi:hypothetical protein